MIAETDRRAMVRRPAIARTLAGAAGGCRLALLAMRFGMLLVILGVALRMALALGVMLWGFRRLLVARLAMFPMLARFLGLTTGATVAIAATAAPSTSAASATPATPIAGLQRHGLDTGYVDTGNGRSD